MAKHVVVVEFSFEVDSEERAEEIVTEFNYGDVQVLADLATDGWGVNQATIDGNVLGWG